jgi:hypothetical protein
MEGRKEGRKKEKEGVTRNRKEGEKEVHRTDEMKKLLEGINGTRKR